MSPSLGVVIFMSLITFPWATYAFWKDLPDKDLRKNLRTPWWVLRLVLEGVLGVYSGHFIVLGIGFLPRMFG